MHLGVDYIVTNYGEAGRTALNLPYFPYISSSVYEWSISVPHDVVIILLGTNDSQEMYWDEYSRLKEDYLYIMDSYLNYPGHDDPVFVLGLPPPVFNEFAVHKNEPIINIIIPIIKQIAYETKTTIANFYNALDGKPELFIDGVHPNSAGAELMAEVAYNAVQKALSTSDIPYNHPPDTPTGLRTISDYDKINLEWHPNTEDDLWSYLIFRSDEEGGIQTLLGSVIKIVSTTPPDTTFSDINVINDHIYYYTIQAMNTHKNTSPRTASVGGKTIDQTPPSAPVHLQVILEADSVKLSWTPNSELDLEKYYVYRNSIEDNIEISTSAIGNVHTPDSSFIDINYDSATNYYYGIKAVDLFDNQGPISNVVNITTMSRPISSNTTLTLSENIPYHFHPSDFPFTDADNHIIDKIIFIDTNHFEYFTYNEDPIDATIICNDISKLLFTPKLDDFGQNYAEFTFNVIDTFGSKSLDTNTVIIHINDKPNNFKIITPNNDSTLAINKLNYLDIFFISWEESLDAINDGILYDIIFSGDLSALSKYQLDSTNTEYILTEILAVTDTTSIATGTLSIIATDGDLETIAINSNIALSVDGRSFAPSALHLDQNYPNPFNNTTVIGFDLPKSADVSIIIYDLLGEEVIRLINNKKYERGYNTITWTGLDKNNNLITAGIYIMQIRMGTHEKHKKLIFLK